MIKNIWNKLAPREKIMVGFVILLLIMILFNWNKVSKGIKDGIKPYHKTQTID